MTDTTKPTGDTIDDEVNKLIDSAFTEGKNAGRGHGFDSAQALRTREVAQSITRRLAERPNRAVARVMQAIRMWNDQNDMLHTMALESLETALIIALTTPTETTDPAMERDDAE